MNERCYQRNKQIWKSDSFRIQDFDYSQSFASKWAFLQEESIKEQEVERENVTKLNETH